MNKGPARLFAVAVAGVLVLGACSSSSGSSSSSSSSATPTTVAGASNAGSSNPGVEAVRVGDASTDASTGAGQAYTPTGTIVADDGFRPAADGLPFQNYGDTLFDATQAPASSLNAAAMQQLYGNAVCGDPQCDLTPEAQSYMDQINQAMAGGHCYGFSVASQLFWENKFNTTTFGASSIPALNIDGNPNLMAQIAYAWTFQTLPSVLTARFTPTDPNAMLNQIKSLMVPNPPDAYTIAIFNGTGGHAITPYAVEDNGNGQFHVLVYDNNYPGITRGMAFDTNADTWNYVAQTNPGQPDDVYSGTAQTPNIVLDTATPGLGTQPWPYAGADAATAGGGSSSGSGSSQSFHPGGLHASLAGLQTQAAANDDNLDDIYLDASDTNHGHLLITNPAGQQIGFLNGKLINTIPGAHYEINTSDNDFAAQPEPEYYVPDGVKYTITLDGTGMTSVDQNEDFGIVASGYELEVDSIDLNPGETDTLNAAGDGSMLDFTSSEQQSVDLNLGVSDANSTDYNFTVSGDDVPAGGTINLALPVNGDTLTASTSGTGETSQISIALDREDDNGEQNFEHDGISLNDGDTAALMFGGWQDGQTMPLTITANGQSTTQQLSDSTPPGDNPDASSPSDTSGSSAAGSSASSSGQ